MLSAVKRIMREACEHNLIDAGAAYKFEKTKGASFTLLKDRMKHARTIPTSKGQMQVLCNLPDTSTLLGLRDKALLYTLVTSGIRASEAADLLTSRIFKVQGGYIIQLMGKSDIEYRDTPLSPDAYMLIQEWLLKRGVDSVYVFTSFINFGEMPVAHKLSAKSVWDVVKHYAGQAGLEHIWRRN